MHKAIDELPNFDREILASERAERNKKMLDVYLWALLVEGWKLLEDDFIDDEGIIWSSNSNAQGEIKR